MAEFNIKCPHCNTELQASEELVVGMEVECPLCKKIFAIKNTSIQSSPTPAADEKNCPLCGGIIKVQAVFCKHCKKNLTEKEKTKLVCQYCAEEIEIENTEESICPVCGNAIKIAMPRNIADKISELSPGIAAAKEESQKVCPICSNMIKADTNFCRFCKKDISAVGTFTAKCKRCSELFEVDYSMDGKKSPCPLCGEVQYVASQNNKNKGLAMSGLIMAPSTFLLCILAGLIGLIPCLAGIAFSCFALIKFKEEKLRKFAILGIGAEIIAFLLATLIKFVVIKIFFD